MTYERKHQKHDAGQSKKGQKGNLCSHTSTRDQPNVSVKLAMSVFEKQIQPMY